MEHKLRIENGVTVASNDGTLLRTDGNKLDAIVAAMKQCSEGHIVEMDVLREYRKVRSVSPTIASVSTTELDYGNVNDSIFMPLKIMMFHE
jgi:hypothetical protein